jgi:hypothetical protein
MVLLCLLLVQWHPSPAGFKYRFEGPDSADRGFNQFIPLAELYNPDNGYLDENDAITVEAAITTSKGTQRCNRWMCTPEPRAPQISKDSFCVFHIIITRKSRHKEP